MTPAADLMRRAIAAPIVAALWLVLRAMEAWDMALADPGPDEWQRYEEAPNE